MARKNPHAVALARASRAALTAEQRSESARRAARARWARAKGETVEPNYFLEALDRDVIDRLVGLTTAYPERFQGILRPGALEAMREELLRLRAPNGEAAEGKDMTQAGSPLADAVEAERRDLARRRAEG